MGIQSADGPQSVTYLDRNTLDRPTTQGHAKRMIHLRGWLLGREYFVAAEAMDFASHLHNGFRKDGTTPEFAHQVYMASYLSTLPGLRYPQESLVVAFLHDLVEDKNVTLDEIERRFGRRVRDAVDAMSKEVEGVKKSIVTVIHQQSHDPIASIVKGADRINNQQTMVGVFTREKIVSYLDESRTQIVPMLKDARRRYPDQDLAYQNIKTVLFAQIEILEAVLAGMINT